MMLAIFFVYFVLLALKIDYSTLLLTLKIVHREMNLDPVRKLPRCLAFRELCRMLPEKRHQWSNPAQDPSVLYYRPATQDVLTDTEMREFSGRIS